MEEAIQILNEEIASLKKDVFEERVKRQANLKIFAIVSAVLLAVLGYSNFVSMPAEVDKQVAANVKGEVEKQLIEHGVVVVRKQLNEIFKKAQSDSKELSQLRTNASEQVKAIELSMGPYTSLNERVSDNKLKIDSAILKLEKMAFDSENNLVLPSGLKIPYGSGISILDVPTWNNGEYRILMTGWESGKGDFLRFFVPGNGNTRGHVLTIYDTGNIEINGRLMQ